ncbi:MAG TPA: hypothetical protein DIW44_05810 [Anaerolineaceae bacterium]|nr:hypothetical protein [Anaerolineaceae bacterium]
MINDKLNHHFIPRFYLKYWTNQHNKLWVYDLRHISESKIPNPRLCHIKNICSENRLYSIGDDNSLEDWADKNFEYRCALTFKKINNREILDNDDIFYTKSFLALTMARHPLMKNSSEIICNTFSRNVVLENPLAQTLTSRMKANLIELDKLQLQLLCISPDLSMSFITSDIPFIVDWKISEENVMGFRYKRPTINRVLYPISPKVMVFLSEKENILPYLTISDSDQIRIINYQLITYANDILIANNNDLLDHLPPIVPI